LIRWYGLLAVASIAHIAKIADVRFCCPATQRKIWHECFHKPVAIEPVKGSLVQVNEIPNGKRQKQKKYCNKNTGKRRYFSPTARIALPSRTRSAPKP